MAFVSVCFRVCVCVCVSAYACRLCLMTNRTGGSEESGLHDYAGSTGDILEGAFRLIYTVESCSLLAFVSSPFFLHVSFLNPLTTAVIFRKNFGFVIICKFRLI